MVAALKLRYEVCWFAQVLITVQSPWKILNLNNQHKCLLIATQFFIRSNWIWKKKKKHFSKSILKTSQRKVHYWTDAVFESYSRFDLRHNKSMLNVRVSYCRTIINAYFVVSSDPPKLAALRIAIRTSIEWLKIFHRDLRLFSVSINRNAIGLSSLEFFFDILKGDIELQWF